MLYIILTLVKAVSGNLPSRRLSIGPARTTADETGVSHAVFGTSYDLYSYYQSSTQPL